MFFKDDFSPCTTVGFDLLAVPEIGEGRVSSNFVVLANWLGLGAVQLGDLDQLVLLEGLGEFIPGGNEFLKKNGGYKKIFNIYGLGNSILEKSVTC